MLFQKTSLVSVVTALMPMLFCISNLSQDKPAGDLVVYDAVMPKLATSGKSRAQTPIRIQSMDTRGGKFAPAQAELTTARIKGC